MPTRRRIATRHPSVSGGGPTSSAGTVIMGPYYGDLNSAGRLRLASALAGLSLTKSVDDVRITTVTATFSPTFQAGTAKLDPSTLNMSAVITRGSNSMVNDGPDNFTNPTNAQGAVSDVAYATRTGQLTAATNANLRGNYQDFTGGIELFTISAVSLSFYALQEGTVLNNGGMHYEYRLTGGAWTSLQIQTGTVDNVTTPATFDITAAVGGSWALLNALEVRVRAVLAIGTNLVTVSVDAVVVNITASRSVAV